MDDEIYRPSHKRYSSTTSIVGSAFFTEVNQSPERSRTNKSKPKKQVHFVPYDLTIENVNNFEVMDYLEALHDSKVQLINFDSKMTHDVMHKLGILIEDLEVQPLDLRVKDKKTDDVKKLHYLHNLQRVITLLESINFEVERRHRERGMPLTSLPPAKKIKNEVNIDLSHMSTSSHEDTVLRINNNHHKLAKATSKEKFVKLLEEEIITKQHASNLLTKFERAEKNRRLINNKKLMMLKRSQENYRENLQKLKFQAEVDYNQRILMHEKYKLADPSNSPRKLFKNHSENDISIATQNSLKKVKMEQRVQAAKDFMRAQAQEEDYLCQLIMQDLNDRSSRSLEILRFKKEERIKHLKERPYHLEEKKAKASKFVREKILNDIQKIAFSQEKHHKEMQKLQKSVQKQKREKQMYYQNVQEKIHENLKNVENSQLQKTFDVIKRVEERESHYSSFHDQKEQARHQKSASAIFHAEKIRLNQQTHVKEFERKTYSKFLMSEPFKNPSHQKKSSLDLIRQAAMQRSFSMNKQKNKLASLFINMSKNGFNTKSALLSNSITPNTTTNATSLSTFPSLRKTHTFLRSPTNTKFGQRPSLANLDPLPEPVSDEKTKTMYVEKSRKGVKNNIMEYGMVLNSKKETIQSFFLTDFERNLSMPVSPAPEEMNFHPSTTSNAIGRKSPVSLTSLKRTRGTLPPFRITFKK